VRRFGAWLLCALALTGCQLYWRKPGADPAAFAADHRDCVGKAGVDVGGERVLVNLDIYRACLRMHGWQRESATGAGSGLYRGLEDEGPVARDAVPGRPPLVTPADPPPPARPGGPWILGAWVGSKEMTGVTDDVTRFDFLERDGGIAWTMTRHTRLNRQQWSLWASGRVVKITDQHVDLIGAYDRSEPPRAEGTSVSGTLRRTSGGLEGNLLGYQQRWLPVNLRRVEQEGRR
jgi:hypothetical protein